MSSYTSLTFSLSALFVSMYQKEKLALKFIIEGQVPKIIMGSLYKILVKDESIPPIENITEEEKESLRQELIGCGAQVTNVSAKILHTIKFINANS